MESRELDLLIVGGGPAGLSTWIHLQCEDPDLAARTLLIEKAVYPRDKLCGGGVVPQADQVLCDLGIDLRVPSVLIQHVDYVFGPNRLRWNPGNAFRVVRRYEFDHALARAAVERGLTLNEGEAFRRFERSGQGLVVETTRGRYRVRALIGADGASSLVRRAMNLQERPRMSRLLEVVTPVFSENPPDAGSDTAVFDFSPVAQGLQGYVWHFPCLVAGVPSFNRGIFDSRVYPDRVPAKLHKVFDEALKDQAPVCRALHVVSPSGALVRSRRHICPAERSTSRRCGRRRTHIRGGHLLCVTVRSNRCAVPRSILSAL